ncbi:glycosyl transferase family protein [Actinobacillus seminis]|uniref:Glycosyl transferase family protein n=1 Tax=Actinobacillus seminis TaxID=722 RepID=A0A380VEV1_9PAST|nr:glycosyltransferase family 25 protein [Actinobacillus seminis]SUU36378.1 glycosyl transferase family protein [Actinobacillus seminis]
MQNYVISLKSAVLRRKHIEKTFSSQQIDFRFFDAFDFSEGGESLIDQLIPNLNQTALTKGEKGCFMSHLLLWKKCVDEQLPYICIFEDDVVLSDNAADFLKKDDWLKERFDFKDFFVLKLETFLMKIRLENVPISSFQGERFERLKSTHYGTAAYIISRQAAKTLLETVHQLSIDDLLPIDHILFNKFLNDYTVYQINPAIVIQELQLNQQNALFSSQIEEERSLERAKVKNLTKKTIWQKLSRELYRFKRKWKEKRMLRRLRVVKFYQVQEEKK